MFTVIVNALETGGLPGLVIWWLICLSVTVLILAFYPTHKIH